MRLRGLFGMTLGRIALALLVVAGSYIAAPPIAAGYIDPLSGSIVFQVLAAGFMAAYLSFSRFRRYVGSSLRSIFYRIKK